MKDGTKIRNFQQWGGLSKIKDPDIDDFVARLKDYLKSKGLDGVPQGQTIYSEIKSKTLKNKVAWGHNYSPSEFGVENVEFIMQGTPEVTQEKNNEKVYAKITLPHLITRRDKDIVDPKSPYRPILCALFRSDRNDFGVNKTRIFAYAFDGRRKDVDITNYKIKPIKVVKPKKTKAKLKEFKTWLRYEENDMTYRLMEQEVAVSRRQGITHLQEMKPEEFVFWLRKVKTEASGILKDVKCVMKIDGLGFRFGKSTSGQVFIEGSRTGPIFDDGAFSAYARGKTDNVEVISRAVHYDDLLKIFRKSSFVDALPPNTKVVAELFYNPMAEETDTGIKFVTVSYDKKKLGALMTIMPYTVLEAASGQDHPNKDSILKALYKESNDSVKIIDPNLKFGKIDITAFATLASSFDDKALEILKSRKAIDRSDKQNLLNILQKIKDDLSDYLLQHPDIEGKFKLGPEIEGIVLHLPDSTGSTRPYKITTPNFKTAIAKKKG